MAPVIDVNVDSSLARVILEFGLFFTGDVVGVERDRLLKHLNRYKIKYDLLNNLILKKNTAMKVMFQSLLGLEKNVATI